MTWCSIQTFGGAKSCTVGKKKVYKWSIPDLEKVWKVEIKCGMKPRDYVLDQEDKILQPGFHGKSCFFFLFFCVFFWQCSGKVETFLTFVFEIIATLWVHSFYSSWFSSCLETILNFTCWKFSQSIMEHLAKFQFLFPCLIQRRMR